MNRKIVIGTMFFLVLAMLATPVMAIGPWQAEGVGNNPHIKVNEEKQVVVLDNPNIDIAWHAEVESENVWFSMDHIQYLSATKAKINNAEPASMELFMAISSDPEVALEYENKWIFFTYDGFMGFLLALNFLPADALQIASQYPDGLYYRYINVGQ